MPKLKNNDAAWQADYDAETMARYQEIISDSKRKAAAMRAAKSKVRDLEKSYNNMKAVSRGTGRKKK